HSRLPAPLDSSVHEAPRGATPRSNPIAGGAALHPRAVLQGRSGRLSRRLLPVRGLATRDRPGPGGAFLPGRMAYAEPADPETSVAVPRGDRRLLHHPSSGDGSVPARRGQPPGGRELLPVPPDADRR